MILRTRSPFSDPEFLKSVNVVPYDSAADIASLADQQNEAALAFRRAQEREERAELHRGILFGSLFSIFACIAAWLVYHR